MQQQSLGATEKIIITRHSCILVMDLLATENWKQSPAGSQEMFPSTWLYGLGPKTVYAILDLKLNYEIAG